MRRLHRSGLAGVLGAVVISLAVLLAGGYRAAFGQTQNFFPPPNTLLPPFDYPPILSTTPVQVLALDPARRRIIFFNPSATATIAFCPSQITRAGATFGKRANGT